MKPSEEVDPLKDRLKDIVMAVSRGTLVNSSLLLPIISKCNTTEIALGGSASFAGNIQRQTIFQTFIIFPINIKI